MASEVLAQRPPKVAPPTTLGRIGRVLLSVLLFAASALFVALGVVLAWGSVTFAPLARGAGQPGSGTASRAIGASGA